MYRPFGKENDKEASFSPRLRLLLDPLALFLPCLRLCLVYVLALASTLFLTRLV